MENLRKTFLRWCTLKSRFFRYWEKNILLKKLSVDEGKHIIIHDLRGVCSHIGHCILMLPEVFRKGRVPWADPDVADPEEIAKVIRTCPSGALSYTLKDEFCRDYPHETEIFMVKNGPYHVIGGIKLEDPEGIKPVTEDHYSLCRCGKSGKKPLCDGTHRDTGFKDRIN
ncbi:MAG: (4Fe-4S)-binding protein [Methanolobus sp.]